MASKRRTARFILLALVGALFLDASLPGDTSAACQIGRFLVPAVDSVFTRAAGSRGPDAIVVEPTVVRMLGPDGGCEPTAVKRKPRRGGIDVRARWRSCAGIPGRVRLRARIDRACQVMTGVIVARKAKIQKPFRAERSWCGDGLVDEEGGEQCEPPTAPECGADCRRSGPCAFWQAECDGRCVSLLTDPDNCGACGQSCAAGPGIPRACVGGQCSSACAAGLGNCDSNRENGCETDFRSDPDNCGSCGHQCEAAESCRNGACVTVCAAGLGDCDRDPGNGCETDLRTAVTDCGRCRVACRGGTNATPVCSAGSCSVTCPDALFGCGRDCVDRQTDAHHCGGCNNRCATGSECEGGQCVCPATNRVCNSVCINVQTDPRNCGQCNNVCAPNEVCDGGRCDCPSDKDVCDRVCVDTQADEANCGRCGERCAPGELCLAARCVCPSGKRRCGGQCVDANTDLNNCGSCGTICGPGYSCILGDCRCPLGKRVCDGRCVNNGTDVNNCGQCGKICKTGEACALGRCICPEGKKVCNGVCTNLESDPRNCGVCGRSCATGKACISGTCS